MDCPDHRPSCVRELIADGMLRVVVQNAEIFNHTICPEAVEYEIKGLACLLLRRRHDVNRRAGLPLKNRKPPRQSSDERCFSVLSRNKNKRLFIAALIRSLVVETYKVIDYENLPILQDERRVHQRVPVKRLSLLMNHCSLNDPDNKIRLFCVKL